MLLTPRWLAEQTKLTRNPPSSGPLAKVVKVAKVVTLPLARPPCFHATLTLPPCQHPFRFLSNAWNVTKQLLTKYNDKNPFPYSTFQSSLGPSTPSPPPPLYLPQPPAVERSDLGNQQFIQHYLWYKWCHNSVVTTQSTFYIQNDYDSKRKRQNIIFTYFLLSAGLTSTTGFLLRPPCSWLPPSFTTTPHSPAPPSPPRTPSLSLLKLRSTYPLR